MSQAHEMVVIIRPSFKKICGDDACRAALFNHILYWIAWKARGQPENKIKSGDVSWYATAEEICEGIAQSWSVNKVRKEIKELVESSLIGQRRNPANGWDQTRHYFFGIEQGKVLKEACTKYDICLNHLGLPPHIHHLLNLVNAIDISVKCNCQIDEMDLPNKENGFTKSGNAIPKETTKGTSQVFTKNNGRQSRSQSVNLTQSPLIDKKKNDERIKQLLNSSGNGE